MEAESHPVVVGRCPMGCGATLFLGAGGCVTCSYVDCPNPASADELLRVAEVAWPTARTCPRLKAIRRKYGAG